MDRNGPPKSQRSPQAMLQRLEKTDAELHRIFSDIRNRSAWDIRSATICANPLRPSRSAASSPIS